MNVRTLDLIASMEHYYDQRAPIYDHTSGYDKPEVLQEIRDIISYMQKPLANRDVLELACGPGFWTQQFAEAARSILATDINKAVLDEARRKPLDWSKVQLMVADCYQLPEFGRRFDAAVSVDAFCHIPKSKRNVFLEGLHDKLKPNAVVMFSSQAPGENGWTGQFDEEGNHIQVRALPDGRTFPIIKNFPDDAEIMSLFKPYSDDLTIKRFKDLTRYVIHYHVGSAQDVIP